MHEYLNCPYCNHEQEKYIENPRGENELHETQCESCEKYFQFSYSIMITFEAHKADCLNTGKHKYKPNVCSHIPATRMECQICGDTKAPTDKEMKKIVKDAVKRQKEFNAKRNQLTI